MKTKGADIGQTSHKCQTRTERHGLAAALAVVLLLAGCPRPAPPNQRATDARVDAPTDAGPLADAPKADIAPDKGPTVQKTKLLPCAAGSICPVYPRTVTLEDLNDIASFRSYPIAVGDKGTVVFDANPHYTTYRLTVGSEDVDLRGIFTSDSALIVLIIGDRGTILRFDHTTVMFLLEPTDTKARLEAVWTDPQAKSAWAVGAGGTILRRGPQASWSSVPSPTSEDLEDIWGAAPNAIFAVGAQGTFLRYDGQTWRAIALPGQLATQHFKALYGRSEREVYAVSLEGGLLRFDGSVAQREPGLTGTSAALATTLSRKLLVADSYERILNKDAAWTNIAAGAAATPPGVLTHLWGASTTKLQVLGRHGTTLRAHSLEGNKWIERKLPTSVLAGRVFAMAGRSHQEVYAATSKGLLRWDGASWSVALAPSTETLISDVWVPATGKRVYALGPKALHVIEGTKVKTVKALLTTHESLISASGHDKRPDELYILTSQARTLRYRAQ